ncbi:Increased rDNA silencing protein [Coniothyrium glycines]
MSSVRHHSLVPQSTDDTQHNVRDAALRGATLAFAKPSVQPKPHTNTYTGGSNGALLAATRVSTPVKGNNTGGSSISRPNQSPYQAVSHSNSSTSLRVSGEYFDRVPSPSSIAAKLAAARYSPLPPVIQPTVTKTTMSESEAADRDVLPPVGSVGNVLAQLEPRKQVEPGRKGRNSAGYDAVRRFSNARDVSRKFTDETSIPSTTSLVRVFESNRPVTPTNPPAAPLHITRSSPPPVRSPKPQRTIKIPPEPKSEPTSQRTKTRTPLPVRTESKPQIQLPSARFVNSATDLSFVNNGTQDPLKSPPMRQKPIQLSAIKTTALPHARQTRPMSQDSSHSAGIYRRLSTSIESSNTAESPVSFKSAKEQQEVEEMSKQKPIVPPPRRSNTRKVDAPSTTTMSEPIAPLPIKQRNQSQKPSATRPPERFSPPRRPASTTGTRTSPSVYHNNYQRESVKEITKHMTGESLSNAIMGAALAASSRNASPAPRPMSIEPLFPPRKHHHHHHSPFHRSPSPPKQSPPKATGKLRTTMRQEPSSSDDEDEAHKYKKKGSRIMGIKHRKHPNKHHEGTRRRWRDQITERERKRYEGVWAANKGIYLPVGFDSPTRASPEADPSLDVLNLMIKEIWTRSRLPTDVLEEIWNLVDSRGVGRLSRFEFVVGLWLIDQRLKGRKLPTKVSDDVWQSARGAGLKVKVYR